MNKYVVELIGTFFLMLTVALAAVLPGGAGNLAPLAIGAVLMVMIFAGGHVSGAHFNPAVTLAVAIRGKCPWGDVGPYIIAQLVGGVLGALAARMISAPSPDWVNSLTRLSPEVVPGLLGEFLFTFALCWVVLNAATAKANAGNSFYGLAIGFTVLAGAYAVGGVTGGVFNPGVLAGLVTLGKVSAGAIWIYVVAQVAAAVVAAAAFQALVKDRS
jgi:aquaporin Z